jgi:GntR family transcriptional regulator
VSRNKIREALKLLEQDGMVTAIQGRGRFVSALGSVPIERPVTIYESITELPQGLGYTVTNVVLSVYAVDYQRRSEIACNVVRRR